MILLSNILFISMQCCALHKSVFILFVSEYAIFYKHELLGSIMYLFIYKILDFI